MPYLKFFRPKVVEVQAVCRDPTVLYRSKEAFLDVVCTAIQNPASIKENKLRVREALAGCCLNERCN